MRIEIIYPEIANLLGEHGSQQLLQRTFADEEIICTKFPDLPQFFTSKIDFIYMGAMTESTQALVLDLWRPYAGDFRQKIDNGLVGFFAGNALDLLGRNIVYEEADTIQALGLYYHNQPLLGLLVRVRVRPGRVHPGVVTLNSFSQRVLFSRVLGVEVSRVVAALIFGIFGDCFASRIKPGLDVVIILSIQVSFRELL